ncbi:conserved hypothetical protein [Theileria orientalis strain Shintoku]|uniref:Exportin-1/Importin-beta-like domain-containing protein n=1 Tax=Theileria orientalis strain Shintoku TaxID=869250 RepID=J4C3X8_THEOR|nr:conserved hypothetical protein [Theileria orientalis strain Shintoku]BAM41211.1 conserved hypothetical protein [Theileria orientalis strain Shintoku]|eukprot:XP_009691512.1 conserved hypothetical protein [Theileria orientalis strain Shintoku]
MITTEILSAVFAAQDGNINATQMLYKLVENLDSSKANVEELAQKLTLSYELLMNLVNLSESVPNETLIQFLKNTVANVTKEKYVECVNILRFYGYTLLVKFVENNWHLAPEPLKMRCKYDIESLFSYKKADSTLLSEYNSLVNQKASQYIATIAVREWPSEWNEFIPFCVNSLNKLFGSLGSECKNNKQALNEIAVFWGVISEISIEIKECLDDTILYKRRIQISNLLKTYIYDIFMTIHRVIVLGVVSSNEQLIYTILTIFRNLASILDGFIFISFDVDEFLVAHMKSVKTSDIIQTISNICLDVCHKKTKHMSTTNEVDLGNEQLYKAKLDRFIKNMVMISECFTVDYSYSSTLEQLQVAQAFRNLLDKNSLYLMENVAVDTLRLLFDYIIARMIMHPSIEVATCSLNACSLLLRRVLAIKVKKGEDIAQRLQWLDHKKLLLCLFIRGLKLGNPMVGQQGNMYAGLLILDSVIANITKNFKGAYDWINSLFSYCEIDEEISVGNLKSFESRFAALRSTILHCCSLLAIINQAYMDSVLLVVTELLSSLSGDLCTECTGYCQNYRRNEKHLSYVCNKYILFDGVMFILESAIFRLRSATIDLNGSSANSGSKDEKMYWLSVEQYKGLMLDLNTMSGPVSIQGHNVNWIRTAMALIMSLLSLKLGTSHRYMLDIRRLDGLGSLSILFLYNSQFVGNVLGLLVNKILFEINDNISNLNKCGLQCLAVFCKNCRTLLGPYVDLIASKIHQCLAVVTNENSRDLLLESLISLTTISENNAKGNDLVKVIMANYVKQLEQVMEYSENLYKYLFDSNLESSEGNRRNLHRIVTMCYSILRKVENVAEHVGLAGDETGRECVTKLFSHVMNILFSFVNFWRVDFFNNHSLRKVLLSPGKDEWLSLQGFNEAIANEDNLEKIVESVFNIPKNEDVVNIRSVRRYNYILRQSLLKLMGTLIVSKGQSGAAALCADMFENNLVNIVDWVPVFHLYQIIKYSLVPCVYSLKKLDVIINKLQVRINQEWKALNLFKTSNAAASPEAKEDGATENKVIHLYYLKVYACMDCGVEILNMCTKLINTKNFKSAHAAESADMKEDMIKDEMMRGDSIDGELDNHKGCESGAFLNNEQLVHSILSCLCSALSWPHFRTINESLRIMRIYARMTPTMNLQLHIKFIYELILYLSKHVIIPKTFNPVEISSNMLNIPSKNEHNKNYSKEYVNTICTLYEALVKCFPQIGSVVENDEVDIQKLLKYQQVVETLKLLTPYLQEQDCILFIKYVLQQNSLKSRSLLKDSIQDKLKVKNYSKYLTQFNKSSLESKSSTEIEIHEGEGESILGEDILYLLLE